jgi:hypothetical protein
VDSLDCTSLCIKGRVGERDLVYGPGSLWSCSFLFGRIDLETGSMKNLVWDGIDLRVR